MAAAANLINAAGGVDLTAVSPIYETSPVDASGPFFLNAAASINTSLLPLQLLGVLQSIEREIGRAATTERGAARMIDLDILVYENKVMLTDRLTIPHPRISERLFVLYPLADLAPGLLIPPGDMNVSTLLRTASACPGDQEVNLLGSFWRITGFRVL